MENIGEDLKDRVRRLRHDAELSQVALAGLSGISVKMIKDIENGRRGGSVATMQALAKSFNISLEELVGKESPVTGKVEPIGMKKMARAIISIPDDVYELAMKVDINDSAWDTVRSALEVAIEGNQNKKQNKA